MQINYPYIVWNNVPVSQTQSFMEIVPVVFELCTTRPNYVHNYCVAKLGDRHWGARVHKLDRYLYRKMRKSQEQYPLKNQILHNFHLNIFFCISDIKIFTYGGGGIIRSEKSENPQEQYPF